MKADSFGEIFLWNHEMDRLIRVLQRMESSGIFSKHEMKVYEVQLEEVRAGLNADFAGRIATSGRARPKSFEATADRVGTQGSG